MNEKLLGMLHDLHQDSAFMSVGKISQITHELKGGEKTCDLGAVRIMLFLWEKVRMITLILPFLLHSHRRQNFGNVSSFVCVIQLIPHINMLKTKRVTMNYKGFYKTKTNSKTVFSDIVRSYVL